MTMMIHAPATIGQRMTRARLWVGLDQKEMADLLGRTRQTVGNWERDAVEAPFSAVAQWARITGRSLDWIAFGDEGDEVAGENKKTPTANGGGQTVRPKGFEPLTF